MNTRIKVRIIWGVIVGVVTGIWLDWYWLAGIVILYAFLEAVKLYKMVNETQEKLEGLYDEKEISKEEYGRIKGKAAGYAFVQALLGFLGSLLTLAFFAIVTKVLIDLVILKL